MRATFRTLTFFVCISQAQAQMAESTPMTVCNGGYCQSVSGPLLQKLLQNGWKAAEHRVDQYVGICGSTIWQRIGTPDSACFSLVGGIPYKFCDQASALGFKKVDFTNACSLHDGCYSSHEKKSTCDINLYRHISAECHRVLSGGLRRLSREDCDKVAQIYYSKVVSDSGCEAYKAAQTEAGRDAKSCD